MLGRQNGIPESVEAQERIENTFVPDEHVADRQVEWKDYIDGYMWTADAEVDREIVRREMYRRLESNGNHRVRFQGYRGDPLLLQMAGSTPVYARDKGKGPDA